MSEKIIQAKQAVISEIADKLSRSKSAIFVDYRGLTVEEDTNLRNEFRQVNVEYRVLKNTMISRALDSLDIKGMEDILEGPTAIAFGYEDPVTPAKVINLYLKKVKKGQIKAGLIGQSKMDDKGVEALAELPSKEVLIAKMLGTLNAPITSFVSVLNGPARALVCALNAISEQKQNA